LGYLGFRWSDPSQSGLLTKLLGYTFCPNRQATVKQSVKPNRVQPKIHDGVSSPPTALECDIWASIGRIRTNRSSLESPQGQVPAPNKQATEKHSVKPIGAEPSSLLERGYLGSHRSGLLPHSKIYFLEARSAVTFITNVRCCSESLFVILPRLL
jgi:hypothetical protein